MVADAASIDISLRWSEILLIAPRTHSQQGFVRQWNDEITESGKIDSVDNEGDNLAIKTALPRWLFNPTPKILLCGHLRNFSLGAD